MDKRKEKNAQVKEAIINAFFTLAREKKNTDFSITDIIKEAGVARVSYYRNFNSKEDIVGSLIDDALDRYERVVDTSVPGFYCYWNTMMAFRMFYDYRDYIVDVLRFGYNRVLIAKLNEFHEKMDGDIPAHSVKRFRIYAYMGALMNTALTWIWEGAKESPEEVAQEFCGLCGIPIE